MLCMGDACGIRNIILVAKTWELLLLFYKVYLFTNGYILEPK